MAFTQKAGNPVSFIGTDGQDTLVLPITGNTFNEAAFIQALGSEDLITINGNTSGITISGGSGADAINLNNTGFGGQFTNGLVSGDDGNDAIAYDNLVNATLRGNDGDDTITAGSAATTNASILQGGSGNDTILVRGNIGSSSVYGGASNDLVRINTGGSTVNAVNFQGSSGNDLLTGDLSGQVVGTSIRGGADRDRLLFNGTTTAVNADAGASAGFATSGLNLFGDLGNDSLEGGSGSDSLQGGEESDVLQGSGGNDRLTGDAGADNFQYRNQRTTLVVTGGILPVTPPGAPLAPGEGTDTQNGAILGGGPFVPNVSITAAYAQTINTSIGTDTITDYNQVDDQFRLDEALFGTFLDTNNDGFLDGANFVQVNSSAQVLSTGVNSVAGAFGVNGGLFVYVQPTGDLWYVQGDVTGVQAVPPPGANNALAAVNIATSLDAIPTAFDGTASFGAPPAGGLLQQKTLVARIDTTPNLAVFDSAFNASEFNVIG